MLLWPVYRLLPHAYALILMPLRSLICMFVCLFFFKSLWRHLVESQVGLVGFPHEYIFAIGLLLQQLDKHAHHGPHLAFVQGNLRRKVLGTIKLRRQNLMFVGILGSRSRTETNRGLPCV